jgi:hypothetical protein
MLFIYRGKRSQRDIEREFPSIIEDGDWAKITEIPHSVQLPARAKADVNDAIGLYHSLSQCPDVHLSRSVREKLETARDEVRAALDADEASRAGAVAKVRKKLGELCDDDEVWFCLTLGRDGRLCMIAEEVDECKKRLKGFGKGLEQPGCLEELREWYDHAAERVHEKRSGAPGKRDSLLALINFLNHLLLLYAKKPLRWSKRHMNFVRAVCEKADASLQTDRLEKLRGEIAHDWKGWKTRKVRARPNFVLDIPALLEPIEGPETIKYSGWGSDEGGKIVIDMTGEPAEERKPRRSGARRDVAARMRSEPGAG